MTVAEIMKEVSYRWSQMDEESKRPYVKQAMNDKIRYENEIRAMKEPKSSKFSKHSSSERNSDNEDNSSRFIKSSSLKEKPLVSKIVHISLN